MRFVFATLALVLSACYATISPAPGPSYGGSTGNTGNTGGYGGGKGSNTGYNTAPPTQRVSISCQFEGSWASLVPENAWKNDDYVMSALIGLAQDPGAWGRDYGYLQPYAAKPCNGQAWFDVVPGRYMLVVGQTYDYYSQRVTKGKGYAGKDFNGYKDWVQISQPASWTFGIAQLNHNWVCFSCPHIYVAGDAGWEYRGEILKDVIGVKSEQVQRTSLGEVKVVNGVVRVRVTEDEDEVSHVNSLLLEINGQLYAPEQANLQAGDASYLTLNKGDAQELTYRVALPDGIVRATAVAQGYYLPLVPLR